jgi:hypothetical protein
LLSSGKLGFDATTGLVMLGAGVEFGVDESEELGEVGRRPALDALKKGRDSRHFVSQFTYRIR